MNQINVYCELSKKALPVLRIRAGFQALLIFLTGLLPSVWLYVKTGRYGLPLIFAGVFFVSAVFCFAYMPGARHKRYRYYIGGDRVEVAGGVVFIKRTIVPIDRIYQIDMAKGPVENAFKTARVIITTAGSSVTLRYLDGDKAAEIAEYLNAAVGAKLRGDGRAADG